MALSSLAVPGAERQQLVCPRRGTLSKYFDGCWDNCQTLSMYFKVVSICTHCWACCGSCFIDLACDDYILVRVKMVPSPAHGQSCPLPHPFYLDQPDVTSHDSRVSRVSCSPKGKCPTPCNCRLLLAGKPACRTGAAGAWKRSMSRVSVGHHSRDNAKGGYVYTSFCRQRNLSLPNAPGQARTV